MWREVGYTFLYGKAYLESSETPLWKWIPLAVKGRVKVNAQWKVKQKVKVKVKLKVNLDPEAWKHLKSVSTCLHSELHTPDFRCETPLFTTSHYCPRVWVSGFGLSAHIWRWWELTTLTSLASYSATLQEGLWLLRYTTDQHCNSESVEYYSWLFLLTFSVISWFHVGEKISSSPSNNTTNKW